MTIALVGIDWGSSNLRAFCFDSQGEVIATRNSPQGVQMIANKDFSSVLHSLIADWLTVHPAIVMCGMIGSRYGWHEAPYASCPASLERLASEMVAVVNYENHWIVPGAKFKNDADVYADIYDVMRGEETQIAGVNAMHTAQIVVTPGTHSKWVRMSSEGIESFQTYMTGELFDLLRTHSILKQLMTVESWPIEYRSTNNDAFEQGVRRSLVEPALLHTLFSVRTKGLFTQMSSNQLPNYLSGLLIGAEIGAATKDIDRQQAIVIVATEALANLYHLALRIAGFEQVRLIDGEIAASKGLWHLWQMRQ